MQSKHLGVFFPKNSLDYSLVFQHLLKYQQLRAAQIILLMFLGESDTAKHVKIFNDCCLSSFLVFETESKQERKAFTETK